MTKDATRPMTAIEWLMKQLPSLFENDSGHYKQLFEKAIEIEREQIENAARWAMEEEYYNGWYRNCGPVALECHYYYLKTYGK